MYLGEVILAHPSEEQMKQIIAFLCAVFIIATTQAQSVKSAEVPIPVTDRFDFIYPDAVKVAWKIENENYQADFKNDKKATKAVFHSDGQLFLTQTEIKPIALPHTAVAFLGKDIPDGKIEMASIIEDNNGIITFNAVVQKKEYLFDWTGQYLFSNALVHNAKD